MMCRLPTSAKPIEKVRSGAYATIRSPLRRTLRSSSESKSCDRLSASRPSAASSEQGKPTKISFVYSNPTDPDAFETAYPGQIALARKLPGLTRLQTSKVWPKEDGSPAPAYRLLDLYFADYAAASAAAAEAGPLVVATVEHATGGVMIAFADVLEDA
jgi:uncharacterized protein (TIGR02118 family)